MNTVSSPSIICLMGPTACGKTDLAIELVQRLPCEIISVDSAMIYRQMNIGTAKPDTATLAIAPHHLIDICDPAEAYSAGQFRLDALDMIADIMKRGKIPLLVGGTMLYFHVLQQGVAVLPQADAKLRQRLDQQAQQLGWPAMHQQLAEVDPAIAAQLHPNDSQRIQRALEVYYSSGERLSVLQAQQQTQCPYPSINLLLTTEDRGALHQRIAKRFDQMLEQGLIAEVEQLYQRGDLSLSLPSMRCVGYRQVWLYLQGELEYQAMREQGIIATRQLAKRQFTWLKRWQDATRFECQRGIQQLIPEVIHQIEQSCGKET